MDYSQFFHIECYARKTSKHNTHKRTKTHLKAVLYEADRLGYCSHIKNDFKATVVYGAKPKDLYKYIIEKVESETDKLGRKIREDTNLMLGGVCSYPIPCNRISNNAEYKK